MTNRETRNQERALQSPGPTAFQCHTCLLNIGLKHSRLKSLVSIPWAPRNSKAMPNRETQEDACLVTSQSHSGRSASTLPSSAILRARTSSATTMKLPLAKAKFCRAKSSVLPEWEESFFPCVCYEVWKCSWWTNGAGGLSVNMTLGSHKWSCF